MTQDLLFDIRDGIGVVTLNRPAARNALTFAMYERLAEIAADPGAARVLIITGAGEKAFAAGTDIAQFRDFRTVEDAIAYEAKLDRVLGLLERCSIPIIAAISGACTGGGAGIAAACDLRLAAANARFGFPIARTLGNCLSIANVARLAALIGPARVTEMIFTARLFSAEEALATGFVSEVTEDHQALMSRAESLARQIAANAPLTMRATKEALRRLRDRLPPDEDLIRLCYTSNDFREGIEAFLGKRAPVWTGR
jgi:enoyl-CoA hydratase/carnithine racemase